MTPPPGLGNEDKYNKKETKQLDDEIYESKKQKNKGARHFIMPINAYQSPRKLISRAK